MGEPTQRVRHAYFPAFDVFRGIGTLFVVLAHSPINSPIVDALRPIGALGVHMFFALSGFLITHRLLEERDQTGRISLAAFYRRRARRILPPALICLAVLAALGPILHKLPTSWDEILACLFFYRNLFQPPLPGAWYTAHFWSLSLEEQFYLIWPVLLVALGPRLAKGAGLMMISATGIWRIYASSTNIYRTDLLADHLLWGCIIALCWGEILRHTSRVLRGALGIAGIIVATLLIYWHPKFWQGAFACAVAVGFILAAEAAENWSKRCSWFIKLGEASYDCYLWQSLFLPLPFAAAALPFVQRVPWSYLFIALFTTSSFLLTFPRYTRAWMNQPKLKR